MRARFRGGVLRQAGKAALAAAMASLTVAPEAIATCLMTSPVAGFVTGKVRALSATRRPLM